MKTPNSGVVEPQMAYAMSFINNIEQCLSMVDMSVKMDVLGSIFSGKMVFENGKCRTAEFNRKVSLRKSQITDLYNAAPDKSVLTSEWLSA